MRPRFVLWGGEEANALKALGRPVSPSEAPVVQNRELLLAEVVSGSVVDGPGMRLTLFAQGCPHHCLDCHNPSTHDFDGGRRWTVGEILDRLEEDPLAAGVTFSGGEPFCQPQGFADLAVAARGRGYSVVAYSGFTLEELMVRGAKDPDLERLLHHVDMLIDGPYIAEERSLVLPFRGSANQRVWLAKDSAKGIDLGRGRTIGLKNKVDVDIP